MIKKLILTLLALILAVTIFSACSKTPAVEITNDTFGNISITPAKDDTVVYPDDKGKLDVWSSSYFAIASAHIKNEKYDIIVGYASFKNEGNRNTYAKYKDFRYGINKEDVTFGGLTGYTYTENGTHFIYFPANTEDAARLISIDSPVTKGKAEGSKMDNDAARELAKTPEVQKVLATLKF